MNRALIYIFFQMVIFTTLFQRYPTLWKSTLKITALSLTLWKSTLIRRCSTLYISTFMYTTLFRRWFDIVRRRDVTSNWKQRWNNVEIFAWLSMRSFQMNISRKIETVFWMNPIQLYGVAKLVLMCYYSISTQFILQYSSLWNIARVDYHF